MWINEGMASYSEKIFLEYVYDYDSYIDEVKTNHKDVIHHAHINDNGFRALHGIPHAYTYGDHSYNKGADVAHTLRGYLGDADFFMALNSFLMNNQYQDVDAYDFRDHLNTLPGIDVTDFFNDWIFNPGFPALSVDSVSSVINGSNYDVTVYVRQRLRGAPAPFNNLPMEVTFKGSDWTEQTETILMSGSTENFTFTLPFDPIMTWLNGGDLISQAVTASNVVVTSTGTKDENYPMFRITTNSVTDSAFVRMEHHWVGEGDGLFNGPQAWQYEISNERYWKVDGIFPPGFEAEFRVFLNGTTSTNGHLDNDLVAQPGFHEDSVVLFYRPTTDANWEVVNGYTSSTLGTATDGYARMDVDTLKKGEYTWGWKKGTVGMASNNEDSKFILYPNPVKDVLTIDLTGHNSSLDIRIYDVTGKVVLADKSTGDITSVDLQEFVSGSYVVSIIDDGKFVGSQVFSKE